MKKRNILITTMISGLLLYSLGFIASTKLATGIIMAIGNLLMFVPLILIGLSLKSDKKVLSILLIGISVFFLIVTGFVLTVILIIIFKS